MNDERSFLFSGAVLILAVLVPVGGASAEEPTGSSAGGQSIASLGVGPCKIDFGVTPDDSGSSNACPGPIAVTTQYRGKGIVFGTAVSRPGVPPVVIVDDTACLPACRSAGVPTFTGDWWCEFVVRRGPVFRRGGVNSFSAELCFIDNPGDPLPDMIAYDARGRVIDVASTRAILGPVQTLTVRDPKGWKRICFVQVVSSNDPLGLSVDCLNYDSPRLCEIPSLSTWGFVAMSLVLGATGVWFVRRS